MCHGFEHVSRISACVTNYTICHGFHDVSPGVTDEDDDRTWRH
jgi:hypothetical protein